jgi:hypothetical protein
MGCRGWRPRARGRGPLITDLGAQAVMNPLPEAIKTPMPLVVIGTVRETRDITQQPPPRAATVGWVR